MYLIPFAGRILWRLAILLSFLLPIQKQLYAENQRFATDSVQKPAFSTVLFQWSFDSDSNDAKHGLSLHFQDTTDLQLVTRGPDSTYGLNQSVGFYSTQWSTDQDVVLTLPSVDIRGLADPFFSLNLCAPGSGKYEHSDYVQIGISTDGGAHFYNQMKVRGSKSGTANDGWQYDQGLHYSKPFRYAVNSSSIYGHVNPDTKDTIDGISRITITDLPETDQLVVRITLRSSTYGSEAYALDNLTIGANLPVNNSAVWDGKSMMKWTNKARLTAPDNLVGGVIELPPGDTLFWSGSAVLSGPLYLVSGYLHAPGLVVSDAGSVRYLEGALTTLPVQEMVLLDTGYHFIGNPAFYQQIDTLPYSWVFDGESGQWNAPQGESHLGRVVYLFPDDVPLTLSGTWDGSGVQKWEMAWADSVADGTTPLSGWNLLSNPTGKDLWWDDLIESTTWPDSVDGTYYGWDLGTQRYGSYNSQSGSTGRGAWIGSNESFWVRLSHTKDPGLLTVNANAVKGSYKGGGSKATYTSAKFSGNVDTTEFIFTASNPNQVFQATLYVGGGYLSTFMSCCDQLFMGNMSSNRVTLEKPGGASCAVAHFPKSVNYPLTVVGSGRIETKGVPGFFFDPPVLQKSTQPLYLKGPGPHEIYWISENHPDADGTLTMSQKSALGIQEWPLDVPPPSEAMWDILGRPSTDGAQIQLKWENGQWIKEVQVDQ